MTLSLPIDDEANRLLRDDPMALLIGGLLEQQIPLERAFVAPYRLAQRLGVARFDAAAIAAHDPQSFIEIFATPPALHRFPAAMAARTQKLAQLIVDEYDADPAAIWTQAADGADLIRRLVGLPGFGKQKAQIFTALLGKQLGVRPQGWREAAGEYGAEGVFRSVADVTDAGSLAKVRSYKQQLKAAARAK